MAWPHWEGGSEITREREGDTRVSAQHAHARGERAAHAPGTAGKRPCGRESHPWGWRGSVHVTCAAIFPFCIFKSMRTSNTILHSSPGYRCSSAAPPSPGARIDTGSAMDVSRSSSSDSSCARAQAWHPAVGERQRGQHTIRTDGMAFVKTKRRRKRCVLLTVLYPGTSR